MGEVVPLRKPHRLRLQCCDACNAEIAAMWNLALDRAYEDEQLAVDEHEPRMGSRWDEEE